MNKQKYFEESLPEEYVLVKQSMQKISIGRPLFMLCFLIAGSYMERKQGTLLFFVFMITLSFFTAFASCTNDSLDWRGFSCANYGLYSYILIDYLFVLLQKHKRTRSNIIAGAVMLGLIYFAT